MGVFKLKRFCPPRASRCRSALLHCLLLCSLGLVRGNAQETRPHLIAEGWSYFQFDSGMPVLMVNEPHTLFVFLGPQGVPVTSATNTSGVRPAAPRLANWAAAQTIDPAAEFEFQWDAIEGAGAEDFVQLSIADGERVVFISLGPGQAGALSGRRTSVIVPPGRLTMDRRYNAKLLFVDVAGTVTNTARWSGAFAETAFSVATILPGSDADRPSLTILWPPEGLRTTNSILTIRGRANDDRAIALVECRLENAAGVGQYFAASRTDSWQAEVSGLTPGTNRIRARCRDVSGRVSKEVVRSFLYVLYSPLAVTTSGSGTVAVGTGLNPARLEVGRRYTAQAAPALGFVFSNWTGSVTASGPRLSFVMQTGLALRANFVPNPFLPVRGNYVGLLYPTNEVLHPHSGFFSLALDERGGFSAKVLRGGLTHALAGKFDLEGRATNRVPRLGRDPLSVEWQLDLSSGSDQIIGRVQDGPIVAHLLGDRTVFNAVTNPAPFRGRYTMAVPGSEDSAASPGGDGFGAVNVGTNGRVLLSGALADGVAVAQRAFVSKGGHWPLYAALYGGQGSVLGWLTFTNTPEADLAGRLSWIRPSLPGRRYYADGFTNETMSVGSRYIPPVPTNTAVLRLTNGVVWLTGGNLSAAITNEVTLLPPDRITRLGSSGLALKIDLPTGLLRGAAAVPGSTNLVRWKGVLLQKQNVGTGFFLGTNQSGRFRLERTIVP